MGARPASHRAPALARREALLEAAVAVVAERGVGGATHRAIAARAGLPLSTTSYFFGSLDELIVAALKDFATESIADLEETAAAFAASTLSPAEAVQLLVDALVAEPRSSTIAQFEIYLEAARRSELQAEVRKILTSFERLAHSALVAVGARRPKEGARAFVALADGFALQRLASPRGKPDMIALREAFTDLLIAALMSDDEHENWKQRLAVRNASGR
jgi:DNA-binding transcriptional regulator YbjK